MYTTFIMITTLFLSSVFSGTGENAYQNLNRMAKTIPQMSNLKHGQWSIYVIDTENGNVILDINGEKSLAPASNLKLLTSAVALSLLGENQQFNTYLEYSGSINKNGTLSGNLYIRGEGDPTLGSSEMKGVLPLFSLLDHWVEAIRARGILKVNGDIIADDSYLDFMPWPGDW